MNPYSIDCVAEFDPLANLAHFFIRRWNLNTLEQTEQLLILSKPCFSYNEMKTQLFNLDLVPRS